MPLTYSGRLVRPGGSDHPSIIDIGVALSRQPRFAGMGKRWFSVLDHTLFCDELVKREADKWPVTLRDMRLAVLLHDAHECITADVPSDVKPKELKLAQEELDAEIFGAYFSDGYDTFCGYRACWLPEVRRIDRRALVAEAHVVGPPAPAAKILELFGCTDTMADDKNLLYDLLLVHAAHGYFGYPPTLGNPEQHPAVKEFVSRMTALL